MMDHLLLKTQTQTEQVMNVTNPNSIYIKGRLYFKGYKKIELHCFVLRIQRRGRRNLYRRKR
uniref:Peptidase A3A domain-containing protein n=1 Tax=Cauliflower mosaic virus TaxID=10641 RepID=Q83173_9VIRU|nr:unknown protein [Cauliflower mosaic virus]